MKALKGLALLAVGVIALAGCSDSTDSTDSNAPAQTSASGATGAATPDADLTIAMVTHGDGGSFWSVAKKGAEEAAAAMGVTLDYQESNNDPQKQAQLIEAAVTKGVDGIAVSLPNPDAVQDALAEATSAGIPIITLNSGSSVFEDLGAITHVGQDEEVAGAGAGEQLKTAGATKLLCVIHEQNNVGLQSRCAGAESTLGGSVEDFQVTGTADPAKTATEIAAKLQADPSIDAVLALNPDIAMAAVEAVDTAASSARIATFDLSADVIQAIQDGGILFAVDQQQYLQGYLPVVFLTLYNTNANTIGGGAPVYTGPGFVTKENAATVAELTAAGTR
jgi:simple sugar transport system substrate-binding protein